MCAVCARAGSWPSSRSGLRPRRPEHLVELFATIALLWRHRLLLVIGGVLAVAVGVKAMQGETQHFGTASAQVVLDTPVSMLLDTAPVGADTLTSRAAVLGDLAETDP